jgi:hypothetical protein
VHKNKLIKGRSNNAIIAACLFIACRQQSVPRTFKEISGVAHSTTTIKDIGRCYKIIRKALVSTNTHATGISSATTSDLIVRNVFIRILQFFRAVLYFLVGVSGPLLLETEPAQGGQEAGRFHREQGE